MKKIAAIAMICAGMISCNHNETKHNRFVVNGNIQHIPDQKIYLEQLYFGDKNPEIIDTAEVKNGKFSLSTVATEEGLYRIRPEKMQVGFLFINDQPTIDFTADINDVSLEGPKFNTKANSILKNLIIQVDAKGRSLFETNKKIDSLVSANDSLVNAEAAKRDAMSNDFKNYIVRFIDTTSDPVVTMFALGYTKELDVESLKKIVPPLGKKFPGHQGIADLMKRFDQYIASIEQPKQPAGDKPGIGNMAPDFTLSDTSGKPFSLNALRGKYVLVDFWASWCGPCRGENPNVVAAYEKFRDKNFTVLGVSLDDDKAKWINAINQDHLNWMQVSDLKQWKSVVVGMYGFDGIPYNVLLDPTGKILATELRGEELHRKLAEILK
ncbi:MAG: AhpC/TSA family protein [Bacteroidetes bacterium]|jgi:peroxiredoxin|nr:AhpC/TSA family protein [Bacteroidota bacterium]